MNHRTPSPRPSLRDRVRETRTLDGLPRDLPAHQRSMIEMFQLHRKHGKPVPVAWIGGYTSATTGRHVRLVVLIHPPESGRFPRWDDEPGGAR